MPDRTSSFEEKRPIRVQPDQGWLDPDVEVPKTTTKPGPFGQPGVERNTSTSRKPPAEKK